MKTIDVEAIRKNAVEVHEKDAAWFANEYGNNSSFYSSAFLYGRFQFMKLIDEQTANLSKDSRILDIGCGTGDLLSKLQKKGFVNLVGIEPAANMRTIAQNNLGEEVVVDGSAVMLPFEDNSFDFITAIEVLRYLAPEDNLQAFKEIYRVLKPGGMFLGTFVNLWALDGFFFLMFFRKLWHFLGGNRPRCTVKFDTPTGLTRTLTGIGFSRTETHGAMIAILRIVWKLLGNKTSIIAMKVEAFDARLTRKWGKAFAGHLVCIATK